MTTTDQTLMATQEVADRYYELAKQELWFQIQDELYSDDVQSIEPKNSPYLSNVSGKDAVRKKGEEFVSRIEALHNAHTTAPIVGANHFVVGRQKEMTVRPHGRIKINQIMLYEVRNGKIVLEQFFY